MEKLISFRFKEAFNLWFAYKCHVALIEKKKIYSWYWLFLPNWRWYLLRYRNKEFKDRYHSSTVKPKYNRVELFKINGYKYKLIPKLITR